MLKQPTPCDTTCLFFNLMDDGLKCTYVTRRGPPPKVTCIFFFRCQICFWFVSKMRDYERSWSSNSSVHETVTMGSETTFVFGIHVSHVFVFSHEVYFKLKTHSTCSHNQ